MTHPWSHTPIDFRLSDALNTWNAAALALYQAGYDVTNICDERTEVSACEAKKAGVVLQAATWPTLAGLAAIVASRGMEWAADRSITGDGQAANTYDVLSDLSAEGEKWVATALFEIAATPLPAGELQRFDNPGEDIGLLASGAAALRAGVPRRVRWSGGLIFEAFPLLQIAPSDACPLPANRDLAPDERLVVFGRTGKDEDLVAVHPVTGHVWSIWEHGVYLASASIEAFFIGAQVMQRALDHAQNLEPIAAVLFVRGVTHRLQEIDPVVYTGDENLWVTIAR